MRGEPQKLKTLQRRNCFGAMTSLRLLLFALLIAVALLFHRKHMWFCLILILIGPLPVNFITSRNLFAIYVPLMGWAIYVSSVLVEGRDWLHSHLWRRAPLSPATWEPERVYLFLVIAIALWSINAHDRPIDWIQAGWRRSTVYALKSDLQALNLRLSPGSRVLFLDDRFTKDDWIPVLVLRMSYRLTDVAVDRVKCMDHSPQATELDQYNYVFDYQGDRLVQIRPAVVGKVIAHGPGDARRVKFFQIQLATVFLPAIVFAPARGQDFPPARSIVEVTLCSKEPLFQILSVRSRQV